MCLSIGWKQEGKDRTLNHGNNTDVGRDFYHCWAYDIPVGADSVLLNRVLDARILGDSPRARTHAQQPTCE